MSLTITGAAVLWAAGFALALVDLFFDLRLSALAILFGLGGATLTVRAYLLQLNRSLKHRERNAFEVGMDMAKHRHLH